MKIYWSPRSPYVRKVMVVAHEKGVAGRLERIPTTVNALVVNEPYHAVNPLGRIPTLVTDDGTVVFDSSVIAEYLDGLSAQNRLLPEEPADRLAVQVDHATGTGILDNLVGMRGEVMRLPAEQSPGFLANGTTKFHHTLDSLERNYVAGLSGRSIDLGQIAVATALAYADFRFDDLHWRQDRPRMAAWFEDITARPSFRDTAFAEA